ncbi:sigma-54-dependent transcriptional regulator [Desulfogranum japonicum]|uniref:sigma-54-dependent transcriptional regulator n=1 Tax=Desulfogranum japonicum TaxID=231447 RepID=UPI0003F9A42F|nr:sigma-54 dependent transcriptional regulator [Desulfogranum japonicum]
MKVLVVDDEANMQHFLQALLRKEGYVVETVGSGIQALESLARQSFDFILCDIRMPEMDGLEFLHQLSQQSATPSVIMMSAYGTVDIALEAMKRGAYDYISKPFKADEILLVLKKAEERQKLRFENDQLRKYVSKEQESFLFDGMVGHSDEMQELGKLARKIAPYTTTVLITGESGTGKELFAKGIHDASPRKMKPFIAINCGGLPENLVETELFGYVKGAFTGADKNKKGLFEEADGGTIFLDEIGELPLVIQVNLLRVLQEREVRPVGSARPISIDVRVIAATARDLEQEVAQGRFREDLLFRLNVLQIKIPPLRKRNEDINQLAQYFLERYAFRFQRPVRTIAPATMGVFMQYPWPGNVRELKNVMERAVLLSDSETLEPNILPPALQQNAATEDVLAQALNTFSIKEGSRILERQLISKALCETGGNKSKASELLEISYPSLLSKIKEYGIH